MAKKIVIELHSEGFREVLFSPGCFSCVLANTRRVHDSIGRYKGAFTPHVEYLAFGEKVKRMKHKEHSGRWIGFIDTNGTHPNFGDILEHKYKTLSKAVESCSR